MEKLMGLTVLFGLGKTSRQIYVVMWKIRFVSVFCATISTKSPQRVVLAIIFSLHKNSYLELFGYSLGLGRIF
jgi:hypothetical protein